MLAEEIIPEYEMGIDKQTGRKTVYLQGQHQQPTICDDDVPDIDLGKILEFTEEQKERLMKIFRVNKSTFSKSDADIGCTNMIEHNIITADEIPIKQPDTRLLP